MSVFTQIGEKELVEYLARFDLGELLSFQGIESGIENTNYFVNTSQAQCVLTLVEQFSFERSRWFVNFINYICASGFSVPAPIANRQGEMLTTLAGKPALLSHFLPGQPPETIDEDMILQLGKNIGFLHSITHNYRTRHHDFRDVHWCRRYYRSIQKYLDAGQRDLIESELEFQLCAQAEKLPVGVIHADLFKDNVFFLEGKLQGIIDFWHSGVDNFAYELAVACNDWCWDGTRLHTNLAQALFEGYGQYRDFSEAERGQWGASLRRAALRFWLSRLGDFNQGRDGVLTHHKDPQEQHTLLQYLIENQIDNLDDFLKQA